jgi:hypothetical protein
MAYKKVSLFTTDHPFLILRIPMDAVPLSLIVKCDYKNVHVRLFHIKDKGPKNKT